MVFSCELVIKPCKGTEKYSVNQINFMNYEKNIEKGIASDFEKYI